MLGNIYEAKPRYELLDELLEDFITNISFTNSVNIIVDVKQIYRKIFRSSYVLDNNSNSYLAMEAQRITSDILGIIGHYRNYFYKKHKYTNFYFLNSSKECELLKALNPEYKKDFYQKYFYSEEKEHKDKLILIQKCTKALELFVNMFPHCKFIATDDFDEFLYTKNIVKESNRNELNVILSNDEKMFQLLDTNVVCLTISGLDTKAVTTKNLYKYFDVDTTLDYGLFSHVLAIAGNNRYSIKGVPGFKFKKSIKMIETLIETNQIQNTKYEIFALTEQMFDSSDKQQQKVIENLNIIKNNFEIFALNYTYNTNYMQINSKMIDVPKIYSIQEFEKINNTVFTNYPLDLFKMLRGEL